MVIKSDFKIMPNPVATQEKLWWMIYVLRASISLDWAKMALEILTSDERRTIAGRLVASTKALNEIKKTLQEMSQV